MTAVLPFTGRVINKPELSKTRGGEDRISLRVSVNDRKLEDDDGNTVYENDLIWLQAYGDFARNIAESITASMETGAKSVRVTGTARLSTYEGSVRIDDEVIEGVEKTSFNILSIGPDLRFATAVAEDNGPKSKTRRKKSRADIAEDEEDASEETEEETDESVEAKPRNGRRPGTARKSASAPGTQRRKAATTKKKAPGAIF